jgi:hypothetical protein
MTKALNATHHIKGISFIVLFFEARQPRALPVRVTCGERTSKPAVCGKRWI